MPSKTIGQYMRMMKSAEEQSDGEDEKVEEAKCTGDSDCECGCNNVVESVDGVEVDFSESTKFINKVKSNVSSLNDVLREGISAYIDDGDSYICDSYMILGYTLEDGLMVLVKCRNEYDEHLNAHFEVNEGSTEFKGFI